MWAAGWWTIGTVALLVGGPLVAAHGSRLLLKIGSWICGLGLLAYGSAAHAEPLKLTVGGDLMLPLGAPTSSEFLPGAQGTFTLFAPLGPNLLVGLRGSVGALMNGEAPQDSGRVDPGLGGLLGFQVVGRLRPLGSALDTRRGPGLFVDLNAGTAITGTLVRPLLGAGLGYGISVGDMTLAPALRYAQVIQGSDPIDSRDARLLMLGVELMFGEVEPPPPPPPPPSDRDGDGLLDEDDACPDNAEDKDGFEDNDGCPENDNDKDGILDTSDQCVNEPEDADGFEDEDGCPDLDNDADGFNDPDDECPNDAEVINGIHDYDGCPDEGLITMIDDRIILDERVLFDFERARIKSKAKPVLQAIVTLQQQHPEWISLRVEGHADARGDAAFNQELSERRAANVRESLVELGIPAEVINFVGYGATHLRDMRENEEAHQRNRRVEFVVVARRQQTVDAGGVGAASVPSEGEATATPTTSATPSASAPATAPETAPQAEAPASPAAPEPSDPAAGTADASDEETSP